MARARGKRGSTAPAAPADDPGGATDAAQELPFEAAMERLESLVDRLEDGELDLEQSLAAFEEGVALSRRAARQLEEAERRIEVLMREGGEWVARPFEEAEDDAADDEGDG